MTTSASVMLSMHLQAQHSLNDVLSRGRRLCHYLRQQLLLGKERLPGPRDLPACDAASTPTRSAPAHAYAPASASAFASRSAVPSSASADARRGDMAVADASSAIARSVSGLFAELEDQVEELVRAVHGTQHAAEAEAARAAARLHELEAQQARHSRLQAALLRAVEETGDGGASRHSLSFGPG